MQSWARRFATGLPCRARCAVSTLRAGIPRAFARSRSLRADACPAARSAHRRPHNRRRFCRHDCRPGHQDRRHWTLHYAAHRRPHECGPFRQRRRQHARHNRPRLQRRRRRRQCRGGVLPFPHCLVTSCFLYCRPEAARRFGTCSRKCAAGAAAQAPLGLNARPATICSARLLGWPGSGLTTPCGVSFTHPTHLWCMARVAAQAASFAHNPLIVRRSARRCRAGNSTTNLVARPSAHRCAPSTPPCRTWLQRHLVRPPLQLPNWWRATLRTAMTATDLVAFDSP